MASEDSTSGSEPTKIEGGALLYQSTRETSGSSPVAVCFFWMDAKERHGRKYADVLLDELGGRAVYGVYLSMSDVFFGSDTAHRRVRGVLVDLGSRFPTNPIVCFAFSNGGAMAFEVALQMLGLSDEPANERDRPLAPVGLRIGGAMFDSCPSQLSAEIAAKAAYESARLVMGACGAYLMGAVSYVWVQCAETVRWAGGGTRQDQYWTRWTRSWPVRWREVFVASTGDRIVPMGDTRAVAEARRAMAPPSLTVEFEAFGDDSPHVGHFRTDPVRYKSLMKRVMDARPSHL
jgi:hypothetical protein